MEMTVRHTKLKTITDVAPSCIMAITLIFTIVFTVSKISMLEDQVEIAADQVEIMRQSLDRKSNLVMTVVPSYDVRVMMLGDGIVEVQNSTLLLSKTNNHIFMIYASNIGDAYAHILGYSVSITCNDVIDMDDIPCDYNSIEIPSSETKVLKPNDSISFEYLFTPLTMPPDILLSANNVSLTFTLFSAETTVFKIVNAQFR